MLMCSQVKKSGLLDNNIQVFLSLNSWGTSVQGYLTSEYPVNSDVTVYLSTDGLSGSASLTLSKGNNKSSTSTVDSFAAVSNISITSWSPTKDEMYNYIVKI